MTFEEWWPTVNQAIGKVAAELAWSAATLVERERCAQICDTEWNGDADTYSESVACNECAAAIREGGGS